MTEYDRRDVLRATGAAATAGLAGCLGELKNTETGDETYRPLEDERDVSAADEGDHVEIDVYVQPYSEDIDSWCEMPVSDCAPGEYANTYVAETERPGVGERVTEEDGFFVLEIGEYSIHEAIEQEGDVDEDALVHATLRGEVDELDPVPENDRGVDDEQDVLRLHEAYDIDVISR